MSFFQGILLVVYIVLLVLITHKLAFFKTKLISNKTLTVIALLKIASGVAYIYISKHFIEGGDIFNYYNDAEIVFDQFFVSPINYFKLVFLPNNVSIPSELATPIQLMGFWGDTGAYMLVRFNALIRVISFGNIYIHGLFAAYFSFIGCFLIAKVFEQNLKIKSLTFLSVFLMPSLLFWTSGIHKEFISVFALGLILYHFFKLTKSINQTINILGFISGLALFFFTRNYMLLALIPSIISYFIYKGFHIKYKKAVFLSILLLITFLNYAKIPDYNKTGFEVIIEKRQQFEDLKQGNTSINLEDIEPNLISLLKNSPKALFNTLIRPHFLEANTIFLKFAMVENLIIALLIILTFLNFHKLSLKESNFIIFMFLYSLFLLLIIGWIVPNIGAILRYRSIALVILIPSLVFVIEKIKIQKSNTT